MDNENKQPAGDLSRILNSAVSGITGMVSDVKVQLTDKIDAYLSKLDLVKREEFELVKAMLEKSRAQQEMLNNRLLALENKSTKAKK
jgi:BMFP domain-containing protein YqiC